MQPLPLFPHCTRAETRPGAASQWRRGPFKTTLIVHLSTPSVLREVLSPGDMAMFFVHRGSGRMVLSGKVKIAPDKDYHVLTVKVR